MRGPPVLPNDVSQLFFNPDSVHTIVHLTLMKGKGSLESLVKVKMSEVRMKNIKNVLICMCALCMYCSINFTTVPAQIEQRCSNKTKGFFAAVAFKFGRSAVIIKMLLCFLPNIFLYIFFNNIDKFENIFH